MQLKTRNEKSFSQTEQTLSQFSRRSATSRLSDLLSYLGPYNPRPTPVSSGDSVWLFDNIAFPGPNGRWRAEFIAAVFAKDPSCKIADGVSDIADKIGLADGDRDEARIEERLTPFLMDIQPGKVVLASTAQGANQKLGPGGRNGISNEIRSLPPGRPGDFVPTVANVPDGVTGILQMRTLYADPDGWAVISGKRGGHTLPRRAHPTPARPTNALTVSFPPTLPFR